MQNNSLDKHESKNSSVKDKDFIPEVLVTVHLQPEEKIREVSRNKVKNVKRLLAFFGIKECTAIVVRDNTLLTPDVPIYAGDKLLVRKIQSAG